MIVKEIWSPQDATLYSVLEQQKKQWAPLSHHPDNVNEMYSLSIGPKLKLLLFHTCSLYVCKGCPVFSQNLPVGGPSTNVNVCVHSAM